MTLNYECILGYMPFLISTFVEHGKLTNSKCLAQKKFILLPKPRKLNIVNAVQSY